MKAWIDEEFRAMVEVEVANHARTPRQCIHAWIDTAFDGHLVMPQSEIERLELSVLADTDAILADGSTARLRCYYCVVEWMGQTVPVQVVGNIANTPLIGTALLKTTDLRINFREGICSIS